MQVFNCLIEENKMFSINNPYLSTKVKEFDFDSFNNRLEVLAIINGKTFNCLIDSVVAFSSPEYFEISLLVLNEVYS